MTPQPPAADELDAVVALIADQQGHPERQITYVGTDADAIRAELDDLEPPWTGTARVVHDQAGSLVGAVVVEWDEALGRGWILGPWVLGDAVAWDDHADALLDAALSQVPAEVDRFELSGDVANVLLGDLAEARGWEPTEANHALVADATTVDAWAPGELGTGLRAPEPGDADAIARLHDAEFPGTYASAATLVEGHATGERVVIIAPGRDGEGVAGYAAGRVQADGEGFIDFVAVDPIARGSGLGRRLVRAITGALLARATNGRVCLTVQDHRAAARRLYADLGFRPDGTFVAYRNWTP